MQPPNHVYASATPFPELMMTPNQRKMQKNETADASPF